MINFETKKCPYCNKNTNSKSIEFVYKENSYLEPIKENFYKQNEKFTFEEYLKKNLKLSKCEDCRLVYYSNWFDTKTSQMIYNFKPHRVGWGSFYKFFDKKKNLPKHIDSKLKIFNFLKKRIKKIDNYAEYNCPFNGLILVFLYLKNIKQFNSKILKKLINERYHLDSIKYKIFKKINSIYYYFLLFLDFIKINKLSSGSPTSNINQLEEHPKNIFLINNIDHSLSWGYGCVGLGQNCRKILNYFEELNFVEITKLNKINNKLDLIYLENTLDHCENIESTLSNLMNNTNNMVIITHGIGEGPQHLYYITEDFIELFCKKKNLHLEIFTRNISEENNDSFKNQYYLISSY